MLTGENRLTDIAVICDCCEHLFELAVEHPGELVDGRAQGKQLAGLTRVALLQGTQFINNGEEELGCGDGFICQSFASHFNHKLVDGGNQPG